MPLITGKKAATPAGKSENISRLTHEIGKSPHVQSRDQAIAIALETARRGAKRKQAGGPAMGQRQLPLSGKPGEGAREHMFQGPLGSSVPGRTDKHMINVKSGAYVVPADVTSILGEGNTRAGQMILHMLFPDPHIHGGPPKVSMHGHMGRAEGGSAKKWKVGKNDPKHEEGYLYHGTNTERLRSIKESGRLETHKPDYGTDQSSWPDGGTEDRSYWAGKPEHTHAFLPEEGEGALVRGKAKDIGARPERGTGDFYAREHTPTGKLQWWNGDDWNQFKSGGTDDQQGVPIIAAGGEHVISPERIMETFGNMDKGHNELDNFVKEVRRKEIKRLKTAPPPKK